MFVISLAGPSVAAEEKKMQTIEGKFPCVEANQTGHVTAVEKAECNGVSVVVGKNGKFYTLYGGGR